MVIKLNIKIFLLNTTIRPRFSLLLECIYECFGNLVLIINRSTISDYIYILVIIIIILGISKEKLFLARYYVHFIVLVVVIYSHKNRIGEYRHGIL